MHVRNEKLAPSHQRYWKGIYAQVSYLRQNMLANLQGRTREQICVCVDLDKARDTISTSAYQTLSNIMLSSQMKHEIKVLLYTTRSRDDIQQLFDVSRPYLEELGKSYDQQTKHHLSLFDVNNVQFCHTDDVIEAAIMLVRYQLMLLVSKLTRHLNGKVESQKSQKSRNK
jgi:hypothetical protein